MSGREFTAEAYENRLAENFKGLDREVKSSDRDMKEYTDKEKAREEEEEKEEEEEAPVNIFSGHVDPQDNGKTGKAQICL